MSLEGNVHGKKEKPDAQRTVTPEPDVTIASPGASTQLDSDPLVQRKEEFTIGSASDALEVEADAAADQVVSGGSVGSVSSAAGAVQRAATGTDQQLDTSLVSRAVDGGGGSALSPGVRGEMESAFKQDLGGVRVHTDGAAAQAAASIQSAAFTVGNDVYFNSGRYNPDTPQGRHLLAHELTHTIQQRNVSAPVQRRLIQADKDPPAGGAAAGGAAAGGGGGTTAPDTVDTSWLIAFNRVFNGLDKSVKATDSSSALYVKNFHVQSKVKPGETTSPTADFTGVDVAGGQFVPMGTFKAPKDQGGDISATLSYGTMPTLGYKVSVGDGGKLKDTQKATRILAGVNIGEQVRSKLKFWSPESAKAAALEIASQSLGDLASLVHVDVSYKEGAAKQDYAIGPGNYAGLTGPKTFKVMVTAPQQALVQKITGTSGQTKHDADSKQKVEQKQAGTTTTTTTQIQEQVTKGWSTQLKTFGSQVKSNLTSDTTTIESSKQTTVDNSTGFKLGGAINGKIDLMLPGTSIPLIGKYIKEIGGGELSANLQPNFENQFKLGVTWKDSDIKQHFSQAKDDITSGFEQAVNLSGQEMWTTSFSSSIQSSIQSTNTDTSGESHDTTHTGSTTVEEGHIQIKGSDVSPSLDITSG